MQEHKIVTAAKAINSIVLCSTLSYRVSTPCWSCRGGCMYLRELKRSLAPVP